MSHKGSPWENGFQESFYNNFKLDLGDPNRFDDLGEFIEAINQTIVEYNERRIHTTLKMSPANFRRLRDKQLSTQVKDKSSSEKGTWQRLSPYMGGLIGLILGYMAGSIATKLTL